MDTTLLVLPDRHNRHKHEASLAVRVRADSRRGRNLAVVERDRGAVGAGAQKAGWGPEGRGPAA